MRFRLLTLVGVLLVSSLNSFTAVASTPLATQRSQFQAAEAALAAGQRSRFMELSAGLRNYPLYSDLLINELIGRLATADAREVGALLNAYGQTGAGERLRRLWLAQLAQRKDWAGYIEFYRDNGTATRRCWYRRALHAQGQTKAAFDNLAELYLTTDSLPDACDPLLAAWFAAGGLTPDLVWQRIRLLMVQRQADTARFQRRYLPANQQTWLDDWLAVDQRPQRLLDWTAPFHPQYEQIVGHGMLHWPNSDLKRAREALERHQRLYPKAPEGFGLARAALGLAASIPARTAKLSAAEQERILADLRPLPARLDTEDYQLRRLRAGLRFSAWRDVLAWIEALPAHQASHAQWLYWRARAQEALGQSDAAQKSYIQAADDRSLWGYLAAGRLGRPPKLAHQDTPVPADTLRKLLNSSTAARIREFQALKRPVELRREWQAFTTGMKREELMAAAVLAQRLELTSEAILTLARSGFWDDLNIRFPLHYQSLIRSAAQRQQLDEAWVLALIRQESLFDAAVGSHAGAIGLMQLMPATAEMVARQEGLERPTAAQLRDPALNVRLGSRYLAGLLKQFNHVALATAAYNAGPSAVRQWIPAEPLPADQWIATIPFRETRDYVARVLAYRVIYHHHLGREPLQLADHLPAVQPSR